MKQLLRPDPFGTLFLLPADWKSAIHQTGGLRYNPWRDFRSGCGPADLPRVRPAWYQCWLLLILCLSLVTACSRKEPAEEATRPAQAEQKSEPESRVKRGTNDVVTITLDAATQQLMGLQTTVLEPASLKPEVKAYGRVLDVSPLAPLVAELTTAQAAGEASAAELTRLKTLAGQDNASQRALQAAEAAAARDRAQVESARLRLLAGWGSAIANRKDLPAFVQSLGALSNVLVELALPAGEVVPTPPIAARLFTLADETRSIPAELVGPAPAVDPQMQGRGFWLLAANESVRLAPGAAVTGFLSLPGEPKTGVALPRNALVRFNGANWVYFQTSETTFERREVTLERPLENGWFVRFSLKPKDKVVTAGAQQLLSEELKGQAE